VLLRLFILGLGDGQRLIVPTILAHAPKYRKPGSAADSSAIICPGILRPLSVSIRSVALSQSSRKVHLAAMLGPPFPTAV
jgi:hypothetical protein